MLKLCRIQFFLGDNIIGFNDFDNLAGGLNEDIAFFLIVRFVFTELD